MRRETTTITDCRYLSRFPCGSNTESELASAVKSGGRSTQRRVVPLAATRLDKTTLTRGVYRSLINNGRTYAAFEEKRILPLLRDLRPSRVVLDPMSGYGTIMGLCARMGMGSYCIEPNPPAFFWGVLSNPINADVLLRLLEAFAARQRAWPSVKRGVAVSEDWFPMESRVALRDLFCLLVDCARHVGLTDVTADKYSLALLLPFAGRLSSCVASNIVTHVKQGGMCVYKGWRADLCLYIQVLRAYLARSRELLGKARYEVHLGDARRFRLPRKHFSAMVTSPPYPNYRDYTVMFGPENDLLGWFEAQNVAVGYSLKDRLIGSVSVAANGMPESKGVDIESNVAKVFLTRLSRSAKVF
jgi:hypothetical protein